MRELEEFIREIKKPERLDVDYGFAAVGLDHGHIYGMCSSLIQAGATMLYVYDRDRKKAQELAQKHGAAAVDDIRQIYEDDRVKLVVSATIPCERGPLGCDVMRHGRDYFVDKAPFTTLEQLEEAQRVCRETGRKYFVYYSERLQSECSILAGYLLEAGFIGRLVNLIGTGPHRIGLPSRPGWFFEREKYGGILCDIGSHQAEQFLFYSGCDDARVTHSAIGNFKFPQYPELDDFGEMHLTAANGVTGYHRIDWYTPDGLKSWGDGRCYLEGTEGFIELRKNVDITVGGGNKLYLTNAQGEFVLDARGTTGFPYFTALIRDSLERTEKAMTQEHAFAAARLCLIAQKQAIELTGRL